MNAPRFARMISRLFASKARTHRPPVPRLRVDRLEERDVPATWNPVPVYDMYTQTYDFDTLASNPNNWTFGYGESIEYFGTATFDSSNTLPCEDFSGSFDSININPGYTGTITLNGDLTVVMFYQGDGTIDQPLGTGSEITITQWWGWEGGTLNSTSTLSSVTLDGSLYPGMTSATIAPANAGTVYLGSNIHFINGALATFLDGTIDAINDPEVFLCQAQVTVTVQTNVVWAGVRRINLTTVQDSFTVGGGPFGQANPPIEMHNNNGSVLIRDGATVILSGQVAVGGLNLGSYYQTSAGILTIESGSTLKVTHGARIASGHIYTRHNTNLLDNVNAQTATIDGDFFGTGGTLIINTGPGLLKHYGTLSVLGTVGLEGTFRYEPYIDGYNSGICDRLVATGNITINSNPLSTATVAPANNAGANTIANGVWRFLKTTGAMKSITGNFQTANLGIPGQPPRAFQLGTVGNPVTELIFTT